MDDRAPNEDPVDVRDQDGMPVQHDGPARRHNQPRRPPLPSGLRPVPATTWADDAALRATLGSGVFQSAPGETVAAAGAASATGCTRSGVRFSFAHVQHSGVQPTHESEHGGQHPVDTGQRQWRRSR
jgi:hypothetical protein